MRRDPLDVAVVAYDRLCTFEFGMAIELFGLPRPQFERWYRCRVASVDAGPLTAAGGVTVSAKFTLRLLDHVGTIVVPGWRSAAAPVPDALVRKLQRAHAEGARILSVCSGAFVLAEAGLLDGKRATTHWRYAAELARRFPAVEVDANVLYVDEGQLITSAGSAAGIDMGLHLMRRDFGAATANAVARSLVVPPHRDGGQQQFVHMPVAPDPDGHAFAQLLDRLRGSLASEHTIPSMARAAHLSQRTFARRFRAVTGTTPHRWLQDERVRLAQSLLESTTLSLDAIAQRTGFADSQLMRLHFKRVVGASPSSYRSAFR